MVKGAVVRITFADARKGVRELDLAETKAEKARRPSGGPYHEGPKS
jgi:hypothetical protein